MSSSGGAMLTAASGNILLPASTVVSKTGRASERKLPII